MIPEEIKIDLNEWREKVKNVRIEETELFNTIGIREWDEEIENAYGVTETWRYGQAAITFFKYYTITPTALKVSKTDKDLEDQLKWLQRQAKYKVIESIVKLALKYLEEKAVDGVVVPEMHSSKDIIVTHPKKASYYIAKRLMGKPIIMEDQRRTEKSEQ